MLQIVDLKKSNYTVTVTPADRNNIAHLAQFVSFDPDDARRYDTSIPVIAYDALEDEYGAFEKALGGADFYDGSWMRFTDGSTIRIESNTG